MRLINYALGLTLSLAACSGVNRSEYESFRNDHINWRNRVDNRLGEAERRQSELESRLTAAETKTDAVRMGIITQLQAVQRQAAQGIADVASASETSDQILLDQLGLVNGYALGQIDQLHGRITDTTRRIAILEGLERGTPSDIGAITSLGGRHAYIAVVRELSGVLDYRKIITPEAYISEDKLRRAVSRGLLPIDTFQRLALGMAHLSPFPAVTDEPSLRAALQYHTPLGPSPESERSTLRRLILEGFVQGRDGRTLDVREINSLLADGAGTYLGARRPEDIVVTQENPWRR